MGATLLDLARPIVQRGRLICSALFSPILPNQSFSQCGEDVILRFALQSLGIFHPQYLDIGAHDPLRLSNSALFYQVGGRGVNVEPDPLLFRQFPRRRPKDVNLAINAILERYSPAKRFDVISLDVEGIEQEILASLNFDRWAPLAFCIETIEFGTHVKRTTEISSLLFPQGYFVYADTWINTIYFHESRFRQLRAAMIHGQ